MDTGPDAAADTAPAEEAKHVTIWNRIEHRKIAGNAAPLRRNLDRYLRKHPECEEYTGQDKDPNRAPIDPVTGHRILHLNEHVPIWHTIENRKVTGNAAPLRKNLATYLTKHPHCEVYHNQDKHPRQQQNALPIWRNAFPGQPSSSTLPANTVPTLTPAAAPAFRRPGEPTASANSLSAGPSNAAPRSTAPVTSSAPMRDVFYKNAAESRAQTSMRYVYSAAGRSQPQSSLNAAQQPFAPPPPAPPPGPFVAASPPAGSPTPGTPSYADMVSSWSNQPEWTEPYPHAPGSFTGPPAAGTPQTPSHFSAHFYSSAAMDTGENNAHGIPIPGRVARERVDIVMGASLGASLGAGTHLPGELACLLGTTPRSMEHEPDMMQFSPSKFLSIGTPARSPH